MKLFPFINLRVSICLIAFCIQGIILTFEFKIKNKKETHMTYLQCTLFHYVTFFVIEVLTYNLLDYNLKKRTQHL